VPQSFRARALAPLLDIATVLAVALALAALYGAANLWPAGFRPIFPPLGGAIFDVSRPNYYPWTDLAENIHAAFLVAHGHRVYAYGALSHMPGVPELIGAAMRLFGFSHATPSAQTATAAYLTASFATLAFQSACVYASLRYLSFSAAAAAAVTLAVVASTAFAYHFALPMSERLIAYLLIVVPLFAWRMIAASDPASRLVAAVWLGGPVTFGFLSLGLTVGPVNVVVALACLCVLLVALWRDPRATFDTLLYDRRCWTAYAVAAAILAATLALCKASDLWFWAVAINFDTQFYPWPTLRESFAAHMRGFFTFRDPLGSRYPELVLALAGFAAVTLIAARREGRFAKAARNIALFVALIALAAFLTQWRFNTGHKSATMFGLTVGVVILLLASLPSWLRQAPNLLLVPLFAFVALQWNFVSAARSYTTQAAPRIPALDEARVCRSGETQNCRCMQVMVFGPQTFLVNDMRPCPDRTPTFNILIGQNAVTRGWLMNDIRNPAKAFWVYGDAMMKENGIPDDAIRYWRSEARCVRMDERQSVCFAPAEPRP